MSTRVTYRRQVSYNTTRNKIRKVRTPGGRIVVHYVKKRGTGVICPDTKQPLSGVPRLRPHRYKLLKKRERRVSRAYGGVLSLASVKERIIRAFLSEEVKIVKKVMSSTEKK